MPSIPPIPSPGTPGGHRMNDDQREHLIPWLICEAIHALAQAGPSCGTGNALLLRLQQRVPRRRQRLLGWPTSGEAIAHLVPQLIDYLQKAGVEITLVTEGETHHPLIRVAKIPPPAVPPAPT